jgi:GTPase SAR1 family protein
MKTEISKFCEAYVHVLNALPPALKNATAQMEKAGDEPLLQKPLATLNDVRARLRSLVEKIESQQAYLLIFGPLKSGKSTLMNAISRSYVSEVTSLPGYPCLVYVRHAVDSHFSVTRYNGRESVFANGRILKDVIADSHIALADQIREAEERNGEFDPRRDFSEAIRRVDVKIPVESLAESSTVLVDTPGLYSRMNFGYDVLTREFRDSAACAVFVVKTDNLYLEQVFAEFNQLLGLFSRIFLVINVDSSKRDLQPDGTLQPSAESRNPQQIIEAFKTLSMAGPLRQAYEDKRLRIHAVDLLSAASVFLTGNGNGNGNGHAVPATDTGDEKQKEAFDTFLADLTDYLNSSDYTQEFMRDSLRQGSTLCGEMREAYEGEEMKQLAEKQTVLAGEMSALQEKIGTADRLLGVNWEAAFDQVRAESAKAVDHSAHDRSITLAKEMSVALDEWYGAEDSLQALPERHWNPLLGKAARDLADETRGRLQNLLGGPLGGAEPAAAVMSDLYAIDFDLGSVARDAASALDVQESGEAYRTAIKDEAVPVKKTISDWLLFRGIATVRRRLFGEKLEQAIAPELKQKRLPDTTRAAFQQMIDGTVHAKFPELPAKFSERLATGYVAKFRTVIIERLRQQRDQFAMALAERQGPHDTIGAILAAMKELDEQSSKSVAEIILMAQQETGMPLATNGNKAAVLPEGELTPGALQDRSAA